MSNYDLSVSYNNIGDALLTQGNLPEALKNFRNGLTITARLVQVDPSNAGWQRDLLVSYIKNGDVLVALGDLFGALRTFRDGLAIAEGLARASPGNAGWQRDLSVSYDRIGDVLVAQGNLPEALRSFRDGLAIRGRLARATPGNAEWQRDLIVSHVKLAEADPGEAAQHLAIALDVAKRLQGEGRLAPKDQGMVEDLQRRIERIVGPSNRLRGTGGVTTADTPNRCA